MDKNAMEYQTTGMTDYLISTLTHFHKHIAITQTTCKLRKW